jgi:ferredoxin
MNIRSNHLWANKAEIYYFSATGNSLVVARDISKKINAKLIQAASIMNKESIDTKADVIGLVFPLYDFKPPQIIINVIRKLKKINAKYLYAVCTYGIAPSHALKHLNKIIKSCGGFLSAGFAVKMPHSGIGSSKNNKAKNRRTFKNWEKRLETICEYIKTRKKGILETSSPLFSFLNPTSLRMLTPAIKFLIHLLFKGIDSLDFIADEKCNGCGICEKICQVNNITMVDHKPQWATHCLTCFACLHWCPQQAISLGGYNMNIGIYHHPDVKLSDMMR